ncbi:hypothetical protein BHE83_23575 (plasmid) [Xanthomonas euvesicatoria pv. vesicatoria str. 85-10]|nr:hypothetical protein BHE83_23575 [Xanthomonas euvesicatoria pv. vesicatoria str. 85-10]
MPHDQAKNFGGLVIAVEAMVFPEYLWQVFAGQNRFWTTNECGKEPIEHFEIHCRCADSFEKVAQPIKLGIVTCPH